MRVCRFLIVLLGIAPTCFAQQPTWTQKCPTTSPPGRYAHALAYDAARSQVVMFGGGDNNGGFNDTWVWDGTTWTQMFPTTSPSARGGAMMAYDAARQQVVLFGGGGGGTIFSDTWVWDGSNWTQKFPSASPPPLINLGGTYDPVRQQVVLFGGGPGSPTAFSDTWVWDGSNWTHQFPATVPPARCCFGFAFDSAHGEALLFGGTTDGFTSLNDTWAWGGTNWTQKVPATSPSTPRFHHRLAYDPIRQQVILFGGQGPNNNPLYNDTWAWDGTTWTQQLPTTNPPGTTLPGMAYDEVHSQIVLFGGFTGSFTNSTWVWGIPKPTVCSVSPASGPQGQTIPNFTVEGSNLDSTALLSFSGSDIKVNSIAPTPTQIVASITIAAGASPSPHDVIVTNANGLQAISKDAFTVTELVPTVPQPDIGVSPISFDFGTVPVQGSVTKGLFVQNTGTASLSVTDITSTDRSFTISPRSFALDPGRAFTVSVTFSPGRTGTAAGILKVASNAPTTAIFVPVQGVGGQEARLILVPSNDSAQNHPLYIAGSNVRRARDKVIADVTVTNVTGTWYELDLDSSTPSAGAPFPIPTQNMPFAFLIGPFQSVTFRDIMFPVGEYLQFDAASDSLPATAMFGIDFIARGIFGVELNSTLGVFKLSSAIFSAFVSTIQQNCAGPALAIGISLSPWSFIEKTAVFMQCTVSNPQVRKAVENLVTKLYGSQTATNYIKIGAGSIQGIIFAFTRIPSVVALAEEELTANHRGFVRLELPRPK
jgi:ASPM-SPD-2-Hydin domain-containing protein/Kelch motif protein